MPELSPNFWHGWVIGLTVLSLIALVWLTVSVYFSPRAQGGPSAAVWDDDLREAANPAPSWGFALPLGFLAFPVLYPALYPGLGDYPGMLKWTQESQLQQSAAGDAAAHESRRARWRAMSAAELGSDAAAMQTAARVFRHNCAACHGEDARGLPGLAPNLTDAAWTWGGGEAQIRHTITAGRTGIMPPLGAALGDGGVAQVAEFVLHGLGGDGETLAAGRTKYMQFCAACHGPTGRGNPALGAPDLTDDIWFYGNAPATVRATIRAGRSNHMPPQGERLTETQVRLLTAHLLRDARQ